MTWDVAKARDQAAHAIAVCAGIGSQGVWGGLVKEERRAIRRGWLAGTSVTEFLFHSRTCAIARAVSESSCGAPDNLTFRSSATALTPYTRSAARAAASRCA
jgi:hypothetical protein